MYTLDQLKEMGKAVAEANQVSKLIATSDGQFFLPGKENLAELHARGGKLSKFDIDYTDQATEGASAPAKTKPKTALELIAEINEAETVDAVTELLGADKRATVLAAAQARIELLTNPRD